MNIHNIQKVLAIAIIFATGCLSAMAQSTLKGVVVNASTGEVFAGANVTVYGTDQTAMTDEQGCFEIVNVDPRGVLEVTAPGCEMQIVPIQGNDNIKISVRTLSVAPKYYNANSLSASAAAIAEGGTSTATAVNEDISVQLSGAMRVISQSGIDAAGSTMFVRGVNSLNMSSQPLFVVDGVYWQGQDDITSLHEGYFSNPLALISPDDIESIQVLKNGTALYGAKGANGVVIINTKRAHNMATEITANISVGFKSPYESIPMMDGKQYRIYASDVMKGMEDIKELVDKYHFLNDDPNSSFYLASHNNTDWMDEINSGAMTQNYGISVRGGDDVALYSFSLGYAHNDGNVETTEFDRLNVRFNSDIKLTKKFTAKADIAFAQIERTIFNDGMNAYTSPTYLAYTKSPLYNSHQYDLSGNLFDRLADTDELGVGNPLAITNNASSDVKNYRFTASLRPKYQFTDRFALSALLAISWDKVKENAFYPDYGLAEVDLYNAQGDWYGEGSNSVATLMTRRSTLTAGFDADWTILKGINKLKLNAGMLYNNEVFEYDYGHGYNTGSDNLKSLNITSENLRTVSGLDNDWRSIKWHLKADYSLLDRYFLSASAVIESNSRFGNAASDAIDLCDLSWGFFPSVELAWVVSNEKFMNRMAGVDYLRLRASFDVAGNDNLPVNANSAYFVSSKLAGLGNGLVLSNIGNSTLKWEKTSTFTAGIDLNLLNNRLALSAEYFYAKTNDLLVQKPLPEEFGLTNYWTNDGSLSNTGFNFTANARIVDSKDWKFNAGLSVGHYKNKVESLGSGSFTTSIFNGNVLTAEGNPLGVFYGYKTNGVFATQADADAADLAIVAENGQKIAFGAGDMHFVDLHADGIIDEKDMQIIGDPTPDIYGHFDLNLQYKRISLDAIFTYSLGNDAYNALRASLESGSSMMNQTKNMLNRWTADGQQTSVPRATYGDPMGNSRFSDRWIEDASYLKLRQLKATYSLPIKPRFIQGVEVWASVNNVFTLTKYLGADPEFSYSTNALYQGIDAGLTPSTRSYHLGVKLHL